VNNLPRAAAPRSSVDSCGSSPWLLSPAGVAPPSPALSPLWAGSGLPPPASWTAGLRPSSATVQRSVSSASSRARPAYAGWPDDAKFPGGAGTRHTANSQPTMSGALQRLRPPRGPGDWIMQNARVKPRSRRPHQLPGLTSGHGLPCTVRRPTVTHSDQSLSRGGASERGRREVELLSASWPDPV